MKSASVMAPLLAVGRYRANGVPAASTIPLGRRPGRRRGRVNRPPRGKGRVADRIEVDLRHRQVQSLQDAVGEFVVAVEAAPQPAAPRENAAVGVKLEHMLAVIERGA